jgi:hypothetical protein
VKSFLVEPDARSFIGLRRNNNQCLAHDADAGGHSANAVS